MKYSCIFRDSLPRACVVVLLLVAFQRADAQDRTRQLAERDRMDRQYAELKRQGRYREALAIGNQMLAIERRVLGDEHSDTAMSYNNLGNLLQTLGDHATARTYHEQALKIKRKILGEEHASTATSYNNLGNVVSNLGDYTAARTYYEQALRIHRKVLGEQHLTTAASYNNLGIVFKTLGDFVTARAYYEQALRIYRRELGEEHADVAMLHTNLGSLAKTLGDYAAARAYYEQALTIHRKSLGEEHINTGTSYNNLGVLFRDLGDDAQARGHYERALDIYRKALGEEHIDTALAYNNLGNLATSLGDHAAARTYFERSLGIRRKVLGEEHIDTATSYNNLGVVLSAMEDEVGAKANHEQALQIKRAILGEEHPSTATSYSNLGVLQKSLGDYAAARTNQQQALKIRRQVLGEEHPDTAASYYNFVLLESMTGDWPAAAQWMDQERRGSRRQVARLLPSLNEQEQVQFLGVDYRRNADLAMSLALACRDQPAIAEQGAAWLLNSKGVAQQALAQQALLVRDARDQARAPLAAQLTQIREQLARLSLSVPDADKVEERRKQINELASQESVLARKLAEAGGTIETADLWVELDAVRKNLPADGILIELVRFELFPLKEMDKAQRQWQPPRYAAFVIPPSGTGEVQIVDLGAAKPIEELIEKLRQQLHDPPASESKEAKETERSLREFSAQLARVIWEPLIPHVQQAKQLLLSPDGALWLLPWSALPVDDDTFLIEKYSLRYVISGRDVVRTMQTQRSRPPVVFADPDFDLTPNKVREAAQAVLRRGFRPDETSVASQSRSLLGKVGRLPGTEIEAAAVKPSLEKLTGKTPAVYSSQYALESIVKAMTAPQIAVFSTHGFFLPDQEIEPGLGLPAARTDDQRRSTPRSQEGWPLENPLLRCGLLFAGCNPRNEGQTGSVDDGVLTGIEIVGIDFRGTDLVVLSACDTGLGRVNTGEGVAGLRQAFQLAGADSVMATLWQIPDSESVPLMNAFFAKLAAGGGKAEALQSAQRLLIDHYRAEGRYPHPFFWGAFTVTGR